MTRRLLQKLKDVVAQLDFVGVVQLGPAADRGIVELRAVAAAQVFQKIGAVIFENLGVVPADRGVIEHNLAAGMPAENGPLPDQLDELAGVSPFDDLEKRHSGKSRSRAIVCETVY